MVTMGIMVAVMVLKFGKGGIMKVKTVVMVFLLVLDKGDILLCGI